MPAQTHSAFPAEHRQRRAGPLPHHRFERDTRHVDEFAQLRVTQQALGGVGHARGRAVESARIRGAHSSNSPVVALLALYLLAPAHERRQDFVTVFKLRYHAAPVVEERTQRQQRLRRAPQRLHRTQRIVPVPFGRKSRVLINPHGQGEPASRGEMLH